MTDDAIDVTLALLLNTEDLYPASGTAGTDASALKLAARARAGTAALCGDFSE